MRTDIAERQTIPTRNYSFDMKAGADGVYVAYIYNDKTAYMKKYLAGGLSTQTDCGSYYTSGNYLGQPQITVVDTTLYASVRDSNGNQIRTFRMDKPGSYTEIGDAAAAGSSGKYRALLYYSILSAGSICRARPCLTDIKHKSKTTKSPIRQVRTCVMGDFMLYETILRSVCAAYIFSGSSYSTPFVSTVTVLIR